LGGVRFNKSRRRRGVGYLLVLLGVKVGGKKMRKSGGVAKLPGSLLSKKTTSWGRNGCLYLGGARVEGPLKLGIKERKWVGGENKTSSL